ncbi:MAG: hypothetical protein E5X74_19170 [Mesorhizobium sp.]|nr:MAG: hypothetical protein EOR75_29495 [Mesorhizobium sp.]TIO83849.1 MAG: hypothetical protein E5X74_19170 [Mesorhizobium sp.]TJV48155.1 MAG: hypothetical protein E5Y01_29450 [Mesorhizobium sp.]
MIAWLPLLPLWEKVSPKATDEGCSREHPRLTPLEHPSSVSALRADPPSPTRGEGVLHRPIKNRRQLASDAGHSGFGIVAPDFSKEKPRLVRSDADPWAGGLGFTSRCRTEPSQATPVNSLDIGA